MSVTSLNRTPHTGLFDPEQVTNAVRLIVEPGGVVELRLLDATVAGDRFATTYSGYFDDPEKLAAALSRVTNATGFYITLNPVNDALLARADNRIKRAGKNSATSDRDITRRRWLLVDVDAERPAGVSATDHEHQLAKEKIQAVDLYLHDLGWPDSILSDSGNGFHLLYPIDRPTDDAGLVKRCLEALAAKFNDGKVKIDTSVHNPARITKLYGTLVCKGDDTPARPHRMAQILEAPECLQPVDQRLLEELAATAPESTKQAVSSKGSTNGRPSPLNIDAFIARNRLDVSGPDPWQGGQKWTFNQSPLCEHHDDGPFLIQFANGALSAGCHHDSCNWGWRDLRTKYEPHAISGGGSPSGERATAQRGEAQDPIPKYRPFPVHTLPGPVGDYVRAASTAIGCDPSFIALPLMACLARAVGNKRVVRLKRTWTEPAVIWAAIIGKSGTHKTPAMQAATRFLDRRQAEAIAKHIEELANYERDKAEYDREYARWKRSKSDDQPPWEPTEPACTRFTTSDCTIEALAMLLAVQFDGLLVSRDELAGWLGGIAEYKGGKGSDLGHWLACWSAQSLTVDRKTGVKKMIHVPRAAVNLVGGIQPGVLRDAIGREHLQDGLCARLLMAMPETKPVTWTDATVDRETEAAMGDVFDKLLSLEPAANEHDESEPFPMDLTTEAKPVWIEYYNRHRAEQNDMDDDLSAAWSKLEAYTARFALIFQLCTWAAGDASAGHQIDEVTMQAAIELSDWFGNEAKRVYGMFVETSEDREQRELVDWISRRGGEVTIRNLTRGPRQFRGKTTDAEAALNRLFKAGVGCWKPVPIGPKGGKPSRYFVLDDTGDGDETSVFGGNVEVLSPSPPSPVRPADLNSQP